MSIETVVSKRIYEVEENGKRFWVLIIFNISGFHYVGLKVYTDPSPTTLRIISIEKYADMFGIREYSKSMIKRCIYKDNKPLEITNDELSNLLMSSKDSILGYLKKAVPGTVDGVTYLKWCKDKHILNKNDTVLSFAVKQNGIYWVNLGYGVGSEMRKIRPVILWRSAADKKMLTIIPLTTKAKDDSYYFHYDLHNIPNSTAKIENMTQISVKRILSPYYSNNKLTFITTEEQEEIKSLIERYYCFK